MRFSAVRQVGLFFGAAYSTAECSWQACGISARHCLASTFGGHTRSSPIILLLLGYSRSALSNLHLRTDAVLFANLARLFSSIRFTIALGRVIIYFSVAKLVCSRVRLKSLGQWRSLTNLPLSGLWFWRLTLTKIKSICLLSLPQPYTALTYVGSVKIILITT